MYIRLGCYTRGLFCSSHNDILIHILRLLNTSKIHLHLHLHQHKYASTQPSNQSKFKTKCPPNPKPPIANTPVCKMTTAQTTGFGILLNSIAYVYHCHCWYPLTNIPKARNSRTRPLRRVTRCKALQRRSRLG